jgi:PIN domain nuclease of toxin-antitoxin system
MRLLLDTHTFLWWMLSDRHLSRTARDAISTTAAEVFVSAASAWEIATKFHSGRLPGADDVARDVRRAIDEEGFLELAITVPHAQRAGNLPHVHRDPFDRMLIAQAHTEELALVSNERVFDRYGVSRVW